MVCGIYSVEVCVLYVFFVKQKTAYDMRISDWSSDVCSSDLLHLEFGQCRVLAEQAPDHRLGGIGDDLDARIGPARAAHLRPGRDARGVERRQAADAPLNDMPAHLGHARSEERRGGKECVSTCGSRGSPYH